MPFTPIQNNLPQIERDILKQHADLLPLIDFSDGISSGTIPAYLEHKKAVPISGARWRNHFTRTLSVFARTRNPSPELKLLVEFIQLGNIYLSIMPFIDEISCAISKKLAVLEKSYTEKTIGNLAHSQNI